MDPVNRSNLSRSSTRTVIDVTKVKNRIVENQKLARMDDVMTAGQGAKAADVEDITDKMEIDHQVDNSVELMEVVGATGGTLTPPL